jgi:hypothetical protein
VVRRQKLRHLATSVAIPWVLLGVGGGGAVGGLGAGSRHEAAVQERERADAAAARVQESRNSRFTLCLYVNRTNAGIRDYLENVYPNPNDPRLNDAQRDQLRQRIAYGNAVFADANCEDVVRGLPPTPLPAPPPPIPTIVTPAE